MEATFPFAWYVDPEIARREEERIFARAWQYVCHLGDLDGGKDFTTAVGTIPLVVGRDDDGTLRAEREDGTPAAADAWGRFVFANPDRDAAPLAEALGPIPGSLRRLGVDVDSLAFHHRVEWEVGANWKVTAENFLECYHCPVAHPGFSHAIDVSPDAYSLSCDGLTSSQYCRARGEAVGALPRGEFHFLWPSTDMSTYPGPPNVSLGPILPAGPERTRRYLDYFFAPDVDEAWIGELLELDELVGREDEALVEGVQAGVRSGLVAAGSLLRESDLLVAHFQRLTAAALATP